MTKCGECGRETNNTFCCDECWNNLSIEDKDDYGNGFGFGTCLECNTKGIKVKGNRCKNCINGLKRVK